MDFSARLTATAADVQPRRGQGLENAEILDIILAVPMFANANRLMQTLGEAVRP